MTDSNVKKCLPTRQILAFMVILPTSTTQLHHSIPNEIVGSHSGAAQFFDTNAEFEIELDSMPESWQNGFKYLHHSIFLDILVSIRKYLSILQQILLNQVSPAH